MSTEREIGSVSESYSGSAMRKLASNFDALATGATQVPRQPVVSALPEEAVGRRRREYEQILTANAGPLFMHFMASIPCVLEELARFGVAIANLSAKRRNKEGRPLSYFEIDAFDGSQARALASFADGRVETVTCSPNPANGPFFAAAADPALSGFIPKSVFEIPEASSGHRCPYDFIFEAAAFQFYSKNRLAQLDHVAGLLADDGIAIFLEKMRSEDRAEYDLREEAKDRHFKTRYFTDDEIEWKKRNFLDDMETGEVSLNDFVAAATRIFSHGAVIWQSTNFYNVVASNSRTRLDAFLQELGEPAIESVFVFEENSVSW